MSTLVQPRIDPVAEFSFLRQHPEYDAPSKQANLARLVAAREAGDLVVHAAPAWIRLEVAAMCNLRCCWAQRDVKHPALRPRGHASPELVRRIVDQVGDAIYQVILCHWGEPTLNPQLPELVRLFHDAGVYTQFDTNMTLITEQMAGELVDAGLDAVSGSIDGASQETYEQYRIGGKLDKALDGMRNLINARRARGRANPRVSWQFLVFPHNEHEVAEGRRLAAEIGVDHFRAFGAGGRRWTPEEGFLPAAEPKRPEGLLCTDPWRYLTLDWDGAAQLCCKTFQARHVVGHIDEQTIPEIFDNAGFQLARKVIRDAAWNESDGRIACTGCRKVTQFVPEIAKLGHGLGLQDA